MYGYIICIGTCALLKQYATLLLNKVHVLNNVFLYASLSFNVFFYYYFCSVILYVWLPILLILHMALHDEELRSPNQHIFCPLRYGTIILPYGNAIVQVR